MSTKRIERPAQTIKANIAPLNNNVKSKVVLAVQEFVSKIKQKHLS